MGTFHGVTPEERVQDGGDVGEAKRPKMREQSLQAHLETLGTFIHSQRKLANLSLRELAERTNVSNPYLSQIERGLHEPSVRVLRSIARALNVSADSLLSQAGILEGHDPDPDRPAVSTEDAIRADHLLSDAQKEALLSVYRSYRATSH